MKINRKIYILLLIMTILLSTFIGISLAKYSKRIEVDEVKIDVIAPEYWKDINGSGFADGSFAVKTNTERTLVFEAMGKSGASERIKIPIQNAQPGLYQLSFTVEMIGNNIGVVDNTKYVYGCTIDGKETLQRDVGYLWKSVTPLTKEDVCLTFEITQEEIQQNTPQYWIWNFGNINDSKLFNLQLTNIQLSKTDTPTNPYIDFPNTEIIYLDTPGAETNTETIAKSSFITTASYNELVLRLESISGCEHFVIPIKGLTAGKQYAISFDELTTLTSLTSNAYDYGAWIAESKENIKAKNILYTTGTHYTQEQFPHYCVNSVGTTNQNNELVFTATKTEMYWIWECARFTDWNWAKINLSNVKIEEK